MTVATATAVEIVAFEPASGRSLAWFDALARAAADTGIDVVRGDKYRGCAPWLLLWGPGEPTRLAALQKHVAAGGHVIVLDLSYYDRDRKARVSFDAPHPQAWVMRRTLPRYRFLDDAVPVADRWNPKGPILVAGIGDKARVQYGAGVVDRWEADIAAECGRRWPERPIIYRKKKTTSPVPGWAKNVRTGGRDIDQALNGCSLVATWHSNVAVDAIRMGIPVVCVDGAAAAVCPSSLVEDPQPLPAEWRATFLGNLAWFQWAPEEASGFWRFVQEVLA